MKTRTIILIGLILTTILACKNSTSQRVTQNIDSKEEINPIRGISRYEGKLKIDSNIILTNQNLPSLIVELDKAVLIEKRTIKDIPNFIKTILDSLTYDNFSIANPGENWQQTDVVMEKLPARQLVYLGIGDSITLLTYFSGGIAESEHILIFKHQNKQVIDFWCGNILKTVKTRNEISDYIKANKDRHWGLNTNIISL